MNDSPLDNLLRADDDHRAAARDLGARHDAMTAAIDAYTEQWRAALSAGWAKTELARAGFTDPARLPRPARARRRANSTAEPGPARD
ncbi:hypothetical protein SAMN05216246_11228 [Actinomyces denticolens]|uniref:Uncharacterized protein n=1 Tax=Actinomyces denticolens TaxID=52767 RepID=A0ABY1IGC3_9ACTO|nr:hypothetical protein [Actinomyces denticolens]SHJ13489.1 hypothetical protein SAMN05216246_11228 [Actinomyces denticolens]